MDDDLIRAGVASGAAPPPLCADVAGGHTSLLALVKALGEPLTSADDARRTNAVALLGGVIAHLAQQRDDHTHAQLEGHTVHVLTRFFCDKLADASAVADGAARRDASAPVPASAPVAQLQAAEQRALDASRMLTEVLRALTVLSSVGFRGHTRTAPGAFSGDDARTAARALFAAVEPRHHPQPLRHAMYVLLEALVARHADALAARADGAAEHPFVRDFAAFVAGEKDPRNLLLLFGVEHTLARWPLTHTDAALLYDVVFCYFPITFRPPPHDPYGITPEQLKTALRTCISATPAFAPLAMPLLVEKLAASGGSAKLDTLATLRAALPVYGVGAAGAHADALWTYLRIELMQPTDDETAESAQDTLAVLLRVLYTHAAAPQGLAMQVLDECIAELGAPTRPGARACMRAVHALIAAHALTSAMCIRRVADRLLQLGTEHAMPQLELLAALLEGMRRTYAGARSYDADGRPLDLVRTPLLDTLVHGVYAGHGTPALHALVTALQIPGLCGADDADIAVRAADTVLLDPSLAPALRELALTGIADVFAAHPDAVERHTLPYVLAALPPTAADADLARTRLALVALARLCVAPELFPLLITQVLALLGTALATPAADDVGTGYACGVLATLQVCVEEKRRRAHTDLGDYARVIPLRIIDVVGTPHDARVLRSAADAVAALVAELPDAAHASFATELYARVGALDAHAPPAARSRIALLAAGALPLKAPPPLGSGLAFLEALMHWTLARAPAPPAHDALQNGAACLLAYAAANKHVPDDAPELDALLDAFWARARDSARAADALRMWVWLARALVARGHTLRGTAMLERLCTLFDTPLGHTAACALAVLGAPDAMLTRRYGFAARMLYKQRLFTELVPALISRYRAAAGNAGVQHMCLVAIAAVLPALPAATLEEHMARLVPMLAHMLAVDDGRTKARAAAALLAAAAREVPDADVDAPAPRPATPLTAALTEHVDALIPRLVDTLTPSPVNTDAARGAALRVLGVLAVVLAPEALVAHKRAVTRALAAPERGIGDARRSVRAHAVDARDAWFRLSMPEAT